MAIAHMDFRSRWGKQRAKTLDKN